MTTDETAAGPVTPPSVPRYLSVGQLREQLAGMPDDALVVVDNGKAHVVPVALPATAFTARELPGGDRYRLGGRDGVAVCVLRAA